MAIEPCPYCGLRTTARAHTCKSPRPIGSIDGLNVHVIERPAEKDAVHNERAEGGAAAASARSAAAKRVPDHQRPPSAPDNLHVIERPKDYLSPDLLRFLADEKAEEAAPHCATCRCGEVVACGIDGCERDGFDDPPRCSFHRVSDIDWDDA